MIRCYIVTLFNCSIVKLLDCLYIFRLFKYFLVLVKIIGLYIETLKYFIKNCLPGVFIDNVAM